LKPVDDLKIVFDQTGTHAQFVRDHLDAYNMAVTGISGWYPLNLYLRNVHGETLGGLLGSAWGGWLRISFLWIDEAVRGRDWGTRLMDQAEGFARERGCHSVELDTHSFQARPFYERRGYEVFGTLDDYPKGHKKFFLRKKL
jgi:ribosomal protein S18 acetylase RimI-like enzyme